MKNTPKRWSKRAITWLFVTLLFLLSWRIDAAGTDAGDLRVPFEIVNDLIVISAELNGEVPVKLFLDTGFGNAGLLLFEPELGKKLGLSYTGQVDLGGGGEGSQRIANLATGVKLNLPGVEFPNLPALVMVDKAVFGDVSADGIVGATLFDYVVEIDYDNQCLNLHEQISGSPWSSAREFELSFTYGIPVIDAEAVLGEEVLPIKLIVDTGASLPFFLFTYSDDRMAPPKNCIVAKGKGLTGEMPFRLGRISSFKIGEFVFGDVLTAFLDEKAMASAVALGQHGFLGHATLQRFNVVFDYAGKRMFLSPNSRYAENYEFNMAGLILETGTGGKLKVFHVVDNSPAAKQKIRAGDLIVSINDVNAGTLTSTQIYEIFTGEGKKVKLTIQRGSKRLNYTLVLRRLI